MKKIIFIAVCFFTSLVLASDVDVAGKWIVQTEGPYGRTMEATFIQQGKKISVRAVDSMGAREGEGFIEGNKISWFVKVGMPGGARKIKFTGLVAGDTMSGTSIFTGTSKVKWSGRKQ